MANLLVKKRLLSRIKDAFKGILLGLTVYEMAHDALKTKRHIEQALMLASIGDMLGLPVSSYYRLRLIPYWYPKIENWKTTLLKEKDLLDKIT